MQGIIETVRCRRDYGLVKATLAMRGSGRVLVVDGDGVTDCALVGGNLGQMALNNDWAGLVVYGTVRDAAELARLPLGVMALGLFPQRGARDGAGQRGETLRFGGVQFAPGHWLSADEDGLILLPTPP
jgi:regulator of ribonuclease activity A